MERRSRGAARGFPPHLVRALMSGREGADRFGRRVLGEILDHLHGPESRKTYSGASVAVLDRMFEEPLPERGSDPAVVLGQCRRKVFRHSMRMSHPRIFGLFNPAPLPIAAFAELPAAFLNQSVDAWKAAPAATHLEIRLIRWINDLIGFGPRAFGVFTSGGGVANTIALKIARDRALGIGTRTSGLPSGASGRVRVYASEQAHFSIGRSLDLLGLGEGALVRIPTDGAMKMRPDLLASAVARDRKRGRIPMAVVATAGTTNTGNIDPLREVARVARAEGLHYHVDAAYGGALLFSTTYRSRLRGLSLADTVTIDPHKWLFQPFSLGGLFVRNARGLRSSFWVEPGYLRKDLEPEPNRLDFYHYSLEGSRRFRGLKLWFTLKTLGRRGLGALVERTMEVAGHLEREVGRQDSFELYGSPVELASVCFRYLPPWARLQPASFRARASIRARLNRVQLAIQQSVEKGGFAWFPTIVLGGSIYFRFGVFNYLTTPGDVDAVLTHIRRTGQRLAIPS
jgi:aromatic-L-amino-acid/L-tryptophan decarboxylase